MKTDVVYKPNTAYPLKGDWNAVWKQVKSHSGTPVWIKLAVTPDLFVKAGTCAAGINRALEKGYLEIMASLTDKDTVGLRVLIDQNMGDSDGFGVEPDDYLVGEVSPDGTFIVPLHIW